MDLGRLIVDGVTGTRDYLLHLPLWLVLGSPLLVPLAIRVLFGPYARLLHPSARSTHHRIECSLALLIMLVLLAGAAAVTVLASSRSLFGLSLRLAWTHWALALAFAFPSLALIAACLRGVLRLRELLRLSVGLEQLPAADQRDIREAAELLNLPTRCIPRFWIPTAGPPLPYIYGLGVGPAVLILPSGLNEACAAAAGGRADLARALRRFFIGHELGHAANGEVGSLCLAYELFPLLRGWVPALFALYLFSWLLAPLPCHWALLPAVLLIGWNCFLFQGLILSAGREREFAADAAGLYSIPDDRLRRELQASGRQDMAQNPLRLTFALLSAMAQLSPPLKLSQTAGVRSLGAVPPGAPAATKAAVADWDPTGGCLTDLARYFSERWRLTHPAEGARSELWMGPAKWYDPDSAFQREVSLVVWHVLALSTVGCALLALRQVLAYLYLGVPGSLPLLTADLVSIDQALEDTRPPLILFLIIAGIVSNYEGSNSDAYWSRAVLGSKLFSSISAFLIIYLGSGLLFGAMHLLTKAVGLSLDAAGWDTRRWLMFDFTSWVFLAGALFLGVLTGLLLGSTRTAGETASIWRIPGSRAQQRMIGVFVLLGGLPTARLLLNPRSNEMLGQIPVSALLILEVILVILCAYWLTRDPATWRRLWSIVWPEYGGYWPQSGGWSLVRCWRPVFLRRSSWCDSRLDRSAGRARTAAYP